MLRNNTKISIRRINIRDVVGGSRPKGGSQLHGDPKFSILEPHEKLPKTAKIMRF